MTFLSQWKADCPLKGTFHLNNAAKDGFYLELRGYPRGDHVDNEMPNIPVVFFIPPNLI